MIALLVIATMASAVPTYDVEKSCRSAGEITQENNAMEGCVADEKAAKDKLIKEWSNYSAAARDTCASSQVGDQTNSYVELYTCFEMQDWKKNLNEVGGAHVPGAHGPQLR
jgi:hypothetical protein